MGLFSRRRRRLSPYATSGYRRRRRLPTFWDRLVWSVDPDAAKEIVAIGLIVFGLLSALGLFKLAGAFGALFFEIASILFGLIAFLIPFVFIAIGIRMLLLKSELLRASSIFGIILLFLMVPALFLSKGGSIGIAVAQVFRAVLGDIGGYITLVGLTVIALLLTFNASLRALWENLNLLSKKSEGVKINENPRVPVHTLKNRPTGTVSAAPLMPSTDNWEFPSLDLLEYGDGAKADAGDISRNVEVIKKTLKDFGIEVTMKEVNVGPSLTQYTLKPAEGVKLSNITARANDIALALAAHPIRIEAPIPGKSLVGVEVPNKVSTLVSLREILEAESFKEVDSSLSLALGRDVAGNAVAADLKKMPHLLIAGATGSGKSVCMNAILVNLLYRNPPQDLRLLLIDPKRVEFTEYNGIAHLLTAPITETDKTISALRWTVSEMERRYQILSAYNRRNIDSFNDELPTGEQKLPFIVVVIDELADLMTQAANEVEASIVRIAQMARAVGIHLIVATQRPSVDVITGLIKANITSRIAFAVASNADSRTILDSVGAEKLLGRGDMLFQPNDQPHPKRIQGVMLKDKEIRAVTDFIKKQAPPLYDEAITNYRVTLKDGFTSSHHGGAEESDDTLLEEARELVIQAGKASASLLQRRLKVGYARAARLLDLLEEEGTIGPSDGAKPRDVLVDQDKEY